MKRGILNQKNRTVKHAISQFNLAQTVPGFDMTIDQILVYIPQLTARKKKSVIAFGIS